MLGQQKCLKWLASCTRMPTCIPTMWDHGNPLQLNRWHGFYVRCPWAFLPPIKLADRLTSHPAIVACHRAVRCAKKPSYTPYRHWISFFFNSSCCLSCGCQWGTKLHVYGPAIKYSEENKAGSSLTLGCFSQRRAQSIQKRSSPGQWNLCRSGIGGIIQCEGCQESLPLTLDTPQCSI